MSKKRESKDTLPEANSESTNSDICVVENSLDNSAKSLGWHHSPPSSTKPNYSPRSNVSPILKDIPTPLTPNRPTSGLKRIIRAPIYPHSQKRPNREIVIAIEKLRPVNKFKFYEPNGNSHNLKFATEDIKFTANSSTPKRSDANKTNSRKYNHSPKQNKHNQSDQCPTPTGPPNPIIQKSNRSSPPRPATQPEILTNIVLKKAYDIRPSEQTDQHSHHANNSQNQQQFLQQLHEQKLAAQQQLQLIEQQLHKSQSSLSKQQLSPPQPSPHPTAEINHTQQLQHEQSTPQAKNKVQSTLPLTPPLHTADHAYPVTAQNQPLKSTSQQETFERQFQKHIKTFRKSEHVVEPPICQQTSSDLTTTHPEQKQHHAIPLQKQSRLQSANDKIPTIATPNTLHSKAPPPIAANKIPSIFIPKIASIESLFGIIQNSANSINYTTTSGQEGGVRVKCADEASYSNLLALLHNNNIHLHTHQMPQDKGVRIVIKNLHATTPVDSIRTLLSNHGYTTKYINLLKNRFTGIPLNMFEVELDAKTIKNVDDLLKINKLGSQEVIIERQAKRSDPVQCHRCQAFGHSKNYCRRAFICMKCAGSHPTTACTKDRSSEGTCANCGKGHVASYKGCPVFKKEREKLLAVRFANQPPGIPTGYQQPNDPSPQQQPIQQNLRQQRHQPTNLYQSPQQPQLTNAQTPKQPQKPQARPLYINSPKFPLQIVPSEAHTTAHSNPNRKTYSQVSRLATGTTISTNHTKPNSLKLPFKPLHKPQQQQLQQQKTPQNIQYHYQQQPTPIHSENNLASNSQMVTLPQQINLIQIQKDVLSNSQSITQLNDKIDQLIKLVYDHLGPILTNKQNTANDNDNDAK